MIGLHTDGKANGLRRLELGIAGLNGTIATKYRLSNRDLRYWKLNFTVVGVVAYLMLVSTKLPRKFELMLFWEVGSEKYTAHVRVVRYGNMGHWLP